MKLSIRIAALGAVFALAASGTHAQDRPRSGDDLTRVVTFADIDLGKPANVALLRRRLRTAAVELCLQATEGLVMGEQQSAFSRCVASSTEEALHDALQAVARGATPARSFALR